MNSFGNGICKLMLGRGLSTALGLITGPIIARLVRPADYGVAGMVMSAAGLGAAFASAQYARAIPLARTEAESRTLVVLCLLLSALLLAPLTACVAAAREWLPRLAGEPLLRGLLWFVPVVFVLRSVSLTAEQTCSRQARFGTLSLLAFGQANAGRLALIGLTWLLGSSAFHILLSNVTALLAGAAIGLTVLVPVVARRGAHDCPPAPALFRVARRHSQCPRALIGDAVMKWGMRSLPVLLLGVLFHARAAGYYAFGQRYLALVWVMVAESVAAVFYPEAAREWRETGAARAAIGTTARLVSLLCGFPLMALGLLAPLLFETVFGAPWREAGVYAQILSPWLAALLLASSVEQVFLVAGQGRTLLRFSVLLGVGQAAALWLGARLGTARAGLACFAAFSAVGQGGLWLLAIRCGGARPSLALRPVWEMGRAGLLLLPSAVAYWAGGSPALALALVGAAGVAHGVWAWQREPEIGAKVRELASRVRGAEPPEAAVA